MSPSEHKAHYMKQNQWQKNLTLCDRSLVLSLSPPVSLSLSPSLPPPLSLSHTHTHTHSIGLLKQISFKWWFNEQNVDQSCSEGKNCKMLPHCWHLPHNCHAASSYPTLPIIQEAEFPLLETKILIFGLWLSCSWWLKLHVHILPCKSKCTFSEWTN